MGKWSEEAKKKHSEWKKKWWADRKAKKAEVPPVEAPTSDLPHSPDA